MSIALVLLSLLVLLLKLVAFYHLSHNALDKVRTLFVFANLLSLATLSMAVAIILCTARVDR